MPRIVSLIASSTEIVYALEMGEQLVGRSHECDYPAQVVDLPQCTAPKFKVEGTSREIDERVKKILKYSLSVYEVNGELLEELQPDVIITQSQCEVCAVSLKDVEAAACQLISSQPEIVSLEPNALADIWRDIQKVADGLGIPQQGEVLIEQLHQRLKQIAAVARQIPEQPTVACIEWIDPLMAAGNWMPELVEMAGGVNLFGLAGKHSPWMTFAELEAADPDRIIIMPCGYDIPKTMEELPPLTTRAGWRNLKAVQQGQVFVTDGNQYFNRPGPRVVESLEILAELCHPQQFSFGHEGRGWIRL